MPGRDDVDAVVLVGGQGTRLRPLTLSAPKPMLPTAGVPFLEHMLSRIREAGITHVVLGTSYKAETFTELLRRRDPRSGWTSSTSSKTCHGGPAAASAMSRTGCGRTP